MDEDIEATLAILFENIRQQPLSLREEQGQLWQRVEQHLQDIDGRCVDSDAQGVLQNSEVPHVCAEHGRVVAEHLQGAKLVCPAQRAWQALN